MLLGWGNGMMSREDIDVVTVLLSEHLPVGTPRGHSIARVMAHLYEARQALPGRRACFRCGGPFTSPVVAFVRDGLNFTPTDALLCLPCGGNGGNTLTDGERARL